MSARLRVLGLSAALAVWIADRVSKYFILALFAGPDSPAGVTVAPFLDIILVWNPGISFGMFNHDSEIARWILVALTLAIAALLVIWLLKAETWAAALALGLVIGGALGNIYDRVWYGAVADFLDAHWAGLHFWTFNVADSAISIGVGLLIWDSIFGHSPSRVRRGNGDGGGK